MLSAGSGTFGSFGSQWQELHRLDSVLAELTRPTLDDFYGITPELRDQIRALGLPLRRSTRREDLIAEVWGRKRPLLRSLGSDDDATPPSCA